MPTNRFIDDEEEVAETLMSIDFDFGLYLKLTLADTFAELIQIHVIDWVVMWGVFAVVFCLYAIEPTLTTVTLSLCAIVFHRRKVGRYPATNRVQPTR